MENGNTGEQSKTTWEEMASVPQYWLSLSLRERDGDEKGGMEILF